MRIVEIIPSLNRGGAEKALGMRIREAPLEIETHVITTQVQPHLVMDTFGGRASIHTGLDSVSETVDSIDPDLVITHSPREALRVLSHRGAGKSRQVVVVAHNEITSEYTLKRAVLDISLPRVNSRAELHIAVSARAAKGPQCARARRVETCYLGSRFDTTIDPDARLWPQETIHRVLVLGRFSPQKNLPRFLDAVVRVHAILRETKTHIAIVGEGDFRHQILNFIRMYQLGDVVSLSEWTESPDGLLSAADALFVSSRHEGGPLTMYEALLAGCRVVSTPVGAAPELIMGDPHLHLLPNGSISSLAQGLVDITRSDRLGWAERLNRRERFQFLQIEKTAKRFYDLCQSARNP